MMQEWRVCGSIKCAKTCKHETRTIGTPRWMLCVRCIQTRIANLHQQYNAKERDHKVTCFHSRYVSHGPCNVHALATL
jgi:hypothetical protein